VKPWRKYILVILALFTAHWMGYWYGRTYELYECSKRYGTIPANMTWNEFLKRK